jgi:hypothetical protein
MNEHVAVGHVVSRPPVRHSQPAPLDSRPLGLDSRPVQLESQPMPLVSQPQPLASSPLPLVPPKVARYEPIQPDEVEAFKRALAVGVTRQAVAKSTAEVAYPAVPVATVAATATAAVATAAASTTAADGAKARSFDGSGKHGPQSYTLLTGFEDTEMPDTELRMPALSGTQYGELT